MRLDTKKLGAKISEYAVFIALVLLVVAMMIFADGFATGSNLLNLLRQAAFNGLIAFGMTLVILSDGIDLSVGSVFAIAAIICAELIMAGMNTVLAVLIALVAGTLLGLISGFLVAKCRLQAFIATLITMTAYRGVAYIITDGRPISRLAESATSGAFFFKAMGKGNLLIFETIKIPIPALILIIAFVVVWFVLTKTTFGRRIYATGSNAKCAKLVGVDTAKVKMACYGISGFLASLAGLLMCSRLNAAQPTFGDGYELDAIAATALGGTSMAGGRGKITGTIAGVLIIAVLNNGMNIMNISSYYQQVVKAVVILVAVLSDRKR